MKLSELRKQIEDTITEILTITPGSNAMDVKNAARQKGVPQAAVTSALQQANTSGQSVTLTGKVAESDEDVEDTYGKEDEDDKKDAKIANAKPSKSDLKKNASIATITDAIAKLVIDRKNVNEKYKKAEGKEKAKLLDELKDLTSKIQSLDKILKEKEKTLKENNLKTKTMKKSQLQQIIKEEIQKILKEAKEIKVDIYSAETITLNGKPLDSDKMNSTKYRNMLLSQPDKAFMYKGKPVSLDAIDPADGSQDDPKIYLRAD